MEIHNRIPYLVTWKERAFQQGAELLKSGGERSTKKLFVEFLLWNRQETYSGNDKHLIIPWFNIFKNNVKSYVGWGEWVQILFWFLLEKQTNNWFKGQPQADKEFLEKKVQDMGHRRSSLAGACRDHLLRKVFHPRILEYLAFWGQVSVLHYRPFLWWGLLTEPPTPAYVIPDSKHPNHQNTQEYGFYIFKQCF